MSDWRESAYLQAENWPECIPGKYPKREYGPYAWPKKTHSDPYGLDDYPASHTDAMSIGGNYPGDVCPYCGVPLKNDVEYRSQDGEKGTVWDLARDDSTVPVYHKDCYRDREAEIHGHENASLGEFA